jgi:hypothetical protein
MVQPPMNQEELAMFDRVFAELAEIRAENHDLRRRFEASATDDRTIALKVAAGIIGRSDEFLRRKLTHGAKFGEKIEGRWVIHAALLREWWAARKAGAR